MFLGLWFCGCHLWIAVNSIFLLTAIKLWIMKYFSFFLLFCGGDIYMYPSKIKIQCTKVNRAKYDIIIQKIQFHFSEKTRKKNVLFNIQIHHTIANICMCCVLIWKFQRFFYVFSGDIRKSCFVWQFCHLFKRAMFETITLIKSCTSIDIACLLFSFPSIRSKTIFFFFLLSYAMTILTKGTIEMVMFIA